MKTKKQLAVTREGEEVPFVEMETTYLANQMKLSFLVDYKDGDQKRLSMILTQDEAQELAKALDNFSYNFLGDGAEVNPESWTQLKGLLHA